MISDHPELCERTLSLLEHQLFKVTRRVPAAAVGKLKKIPIWVEVNEPHHKCMAYHPDAGWLRSHDMNPDKAGCVEIANARNFLVWTIEQPYMVLHELAHGYHHRFLGGFDNAEILAAYRAAKQNKRYDSVLRYNGKQVRAYAATNQMEYFAELSEAYFGTNDFYPFVRSELRKHDPEMYELLGNLWGDRPSSVRQEKKAGEQKRGSPPYPVRPRPGIKGDILLFWKSRMSPLSPFPLSPLDVSRGECVPEFDVFVRACYARRASLLIALVGSRRADRGRGHSARIPLHPSYRTALWNR